MNLDRKIDIFTQRLAQDPHSRVFAPLADLLRQAGHWDDALELLDDGLSRHPDYISALVIKGCTLLDAGRVDEARQALACALELDAENFVVLCLLAEDARSRQDWEGSISLLEKLVVLDPDDDRWPGALAEAKQFAARDLPVGSADSSFVTMTLVDIYLTQGYRSKALAALNHMIAREPDRKDVLQRIAEIQAESSIAPPGMERRIPSIQTPAAGHGDRRAAQRSSEKKQFKEWINRIRQQDGPSQ